MEKKNVLLLAIFTATTISAFAQSGGAYIDNVADSEAIELGLLPQPMGDTSNENRFWTRREVSASYSFSHATINPNPFDFSSDVHSFMPELYLESSKGLSLNIGGLYAHSESGDDFFFGQREGNAYGISVQPAYDTFSLWRPEDRPQFMEHSKLIAGLGLSYTYQNYDENSGFLFPSSVKVESHTFAIYPNLVFVQPVSDKFVTFLIPAYGRQWTHSKLKSNGYSQNGDSRYGMFTLTARGDYKISERFIGSVFATWKRDMNGIPDDEKLDWGEFGGQLRFAISQRLALRVGYSYETFREGFNTHNCFARLQAAF